MSSVNIVCDGDSITAGYGSLDAPTGSYPARMIALLPGSGSYTYTLNNIGTSGIGAGDINSGFAGRGGAAFDGSKDLNIFTLMAGTNDMAGGASVGLTYLYLRAIIAQARLAGYQRVVLGTLIARDIEGTNPGFAGALTALNYLIRANWNGDLDADYLMDFGADLHFDATADADNTTFYYDTTHPNDTGYAILAPIAATQVTNALSSAGTRVAIPATFSPIYPYEISEFLALSDGNRTISIPGGFGDFCAKGFPWKKAGKWTWEFYIPSASNEVHFGITNGGIDINSHGVWPGDSATGSIGYSFTGAVTLNGAAVATLAGYGPGDYVQSAVDMDAKLAWFRKGSGSWNGGGSADPATGVGGYDISSIATDRIWPIAGVLNGTDSVTSRFTAAEMTNPAPAGFEALDFTMPAPTPAPTPVPTSAPTPAPTPPPTAAPTPPPTAAPTPPPTAAPTPPPTAAPTSAPTPAPTPAPVELPEIIYSSMSVVVIDNPNTPVYVIPQPV